MRRRIKRLLGAFTSKAPATGATLLIYHRIGGGTSDELDVAVEDFAKHLDVLSQYDVVSIDNALDRLDAGDESPTFVLTFDDGFADVYENAWPLLQDRRIPFTIYLATAYMERAMRWEGSTAQESTGRGLSWDQLEEMVASGLCTIGNHTHSHVPPDQLNETELDLCNAEILARLGVQPKHFTYPWGVSVPTAETWLAARFRSASTGHLGRNRPGTNYLRLKRVPVRRTDPEGFFRAKLTGGLGAERVYAGIVRAAKRFANH